MRESEEFVEDAALLEEAGEKARIRDVYDRRQTGDSRYSWFNPGQVFLVQGLERRLLQLLQRYKFTELRSKKICEVGCGTGHWLRAFIEWGAKPEQVTGIDLLPERIARAHDLCPPGVDLQYGSATHIDFPDGTFDCVFQATVFSSILEPQMKHHLATEMLRVVKPDGIIVWYDYHANNPWNPDVQGIKWPEIRQLFPACQIRLQRTTLVPPLVRRLAPYSWLLCSILEKFPLLRTHYLGVIQESAGKKVLGKE